MTAVEVVAVTHRGRERQRNEDTVAVAGFQCSAYEGQPVRLAVDPVRPVPLLVADGLGGHAQGSRASRLAAAVVTDSAPSLHDKTAVVQAVEAANDAIYQEMTYAHSWHSMGATIVLLVLTGGRAICVNVGDSRCFLLRDAALVQISQDDTPVPAPGRTAPATIVTQTLGGRPSPSPVSPHAYEMDLRPGDRFLLCSDGLTDELPLDVIETALLENDDLQAAASALLRSALDAGGRDNVSIVLASWGSRGEPAAVAAAAVPKKRSRWPRMRRTAGEEGPKA